MSSEVVNVLIVDDREEGLIALEATLKGLPFVRLMRAHSGMEALSYMPEHDFAVILLDVQMPELDGFQTAELIRKNHEKYKLTPIIFVTAINKDDQYIHRGYQVGAVDYVFKPIEPQILRSKVSVFVDLYMKSQQIKAQMEVIRHSERRERYLKLAELEVESLKRYRNLADAIPHIVWKSKVDGTLDYFNKVWSDYTGLSTEQSIGSGWQNAIHSEDLNNFLKVWIQAMDQQKSFEIEARIRRFDGEFHWHWIRAVPEIRHKDPTAWLGTCTDIHDRKMSESQLVDAKKIAVSANLAKTNFLANMSHEIRTPMSAILGFTELMLNPQQTEEQRRHCISTIRRSGQQLLSIIDEILDISKVEAGHLLVERIEVNVISLLSDLQSLLSVQTQSKKLNLDFRLQSPIPECIHSDPTRLRQIAMNVIGNAIKFTEKGNVTVTVAWEGGSDPLQGKLVLLVSDTGVGIDVNAQDRLFQPFAQVDNSTTRRFGGTGLGLALSRKIAQALGGDVSIQSSEPGIGSTFRIEVATTIKKGTLWVEHLSSISLAQEHSRNIHKKNAHLLEGVKILLVDDAPDNQTVIGLFLGSAGAHVEFADNGLEGVNKALAGNYNLVLMDIQMPQVDGYEATQRLREQGYKKPIIALTAHALKEERDRCLSVGCTDHFTKPIDRDKLISLVNQVVTQA